MTLNECAAFTCLAESTIYTKVCRKQIPYYKVGHKVLFNVDEVRRWLLGQRVLTDEEYIYCISKGGNNGKLQKQNDSRTTKKLINKKNERVYR